MKKFFLRDSFYPKKNILKSDNIFKYISNFVLEHKNLDSFLIEDISSKENIRESSLLFLSKNDIDLQSITKNIHIITNLKSLNFNHFKNITLVSDMDYCYNVLLNHMYSHDDSLNFNDDFNLLNGSYISKYSKIDKDAEIGRNCTISRGVIIGKECIIKNNVTIKNSILKDKIIISDNSTLGSSGFGFNYKRRGASNLNPQLGIVYIDDNVHIGSNCTIDRAKIDITYIGKNSMIDNLVHVGHNVRIGDNACIAAQVGISGSVNIGHNCTIGGQVGIAGHIKIDDNVIIAAKSGVTKNIKKNMTIAGFPATDIKEWKKSIIRQRK